MTLHEAASQELTDAIVAYAVDRVRLDNPPLDRPRSAGDLRAAVGRTVTAHGIGGLEALQLFADVLAPACISVDHPRFLSFVSTAPTEASVLFDLVVGASSIYGGSWLEGAGAVFAENEALRYVADLAGLPPSAGGVFVSGGTAGNLSALIAARYRWRARAAGRLDRTRGLLLASKAAHSSVASAARAMDADVLLVPADAEGRMHGEALRTTVAEMAQVDVDRTFAIVCTCGTTNAGVIDDIAGAAAVAESLNVWLHVDGAYGGAGLAAPSVRAKYAGIEQADSFIVDPHKWLFAPFDCCALVYRDPDVARAAHTQHAEYLDVLHLRTSAPDITNDEPRAHPPDPFAVAGEVPWNPSDYAHHLSRRARGLPFWFSLATYGTEAYSAAVERTLEVTRRAAELIRTSAHVQLVIEPELSVVLLRRLGWSAAQYQAWSDDQLAAGESFVVPTSWNGETLLRFCIVNPLTTEDDIAAILRSLERD